MATRMTLGTCWFKCRSTADAMLFPPAEHGSALRDAVASADSGVSRGVLHLQRDPTVHVQVLGAEQSGGDH